MYIRTSGFTIILWYLPPAGWEREYRGRSNLKQERVGALLDTWLETANDDDMVEAQALVICMGLRYVAPQNKDE